MSFWLNAGGKIILGAGGSASICDNCPCDDVCTDCDIWTDTEGVGSAVEGLGEQIACEVRFGDNSAGTAGANREMGIHWGGTGTATQAEDGLAWSSGVSQAFEVTYDGYSQQVTFKVGATTISKTDTTNYPEWVDTIAFRARTTLAGAEVKFTNVEIRGYSGGPIAQAIACDIEATGSSGLRVCLERASLGSASQEWFISGDITLTWTGSPTATQLNGQIYLENSCTPDCASLPTTLSLDSYSNVYTLDSAETLTHDTGCKWKTSTTVSFDGGTYFDTVYVVWTPEDNDWKMTLGDYYGEMGANDIMYGGGCGTLEGSYDDLGSATAVIS